MSGVQMSDLSVETRCHVVALRTHAAKEPWLALVAKHLEALAAELESAKARIVELDERLVIADNELEQSR